MKTLLFHPLLYTLLYRTPVPNPDRSHCQPGPNRPMLCRQLALATQPVPARKHQPVQFWTDHHWDFTGCSSERNTTATIGVATVCLTRRQGSDDRDPIQCFYSFTGSGHLAVSCHFLPTSESTFDAKYVGPPTSSIPTLSV